MPSINKAIIRAGLETLYFSGTHRIARPFLSGVGAILTFHRVRPETGDAFQPNRVLEITPTFLDQLLTRLRAADVDFITLDEVHRRLRDGDLSRRFVALTFDDGYRDNRNHALPILKRHGVPFTLYVPSSFAEGTGELWWVALERAIARSDQVEIARDGETRIHACADPVAKQETFETIYWWLRSLPDETEIRGVVRALAARAGIDMPAICRELCMDWDELRDFGRERLVSFGGHTANHVMLAKLADADAVEREMRAGIEAIENELGVSPAHFSYPVGDCTSAATREFEAAHRLGFKTAVTTRPGVLFPDHADHLTALPRISVNGGFQRFRYLDVLLSGAPTALMNGFRRVDAA
jgi:peptidoglycan/xylan/chitin deacetylase (PgdA/CDA1 family)